MKLMRKYRVFVCAVLILCFFSFHISRPRQALAIVPAVSLAAAAVLAVGAAAGLSYTFDNADAESIAGRLQAFLDDVHPGTAIASYFSARGAAVKDGLMYIGASLYSRIKEFLQWESSGVSVGETSVVSQSGQEVFYSYDDIMINCTHLTCEHTSSVNYVVAAYVYNSGVVWPVDASGAISDTIIIALDAIHYIKMTSELNNSNKMVTYMYYSSDAGLNYQKSSWYCNTYDTAIAGKCYLTFYLSYTANNSSAIDSGVLVPRPVIISTGEEICTDVNSEYYGLVKVLRTFGVNYPFTYQTLLSTDSDYMDRVQNVSTLSLTASDVITYPDVLEGQSVCVDVGLLSDATIDEVADEIIDAAIDGTLSPSISAETWTVDVVATPQELAEDLDTDLTTEVEENPTVPDSETIEFDTPNHYTVRDLRQFFPFCIPFDLFDMLGVLAAQPVAPHFEYRFQPGIANIDYTIVIDFQQFNSVALLLRRLETLSFCIGLAMVTRNLIRG